MQDTEATQHDSNKSSLPSWSGDSRAPSCMGSPYPRISRKSIDSLPMTKCFSGQSSDRRAISSSYDSQSFAHNSGLCLNILPNSSAGGAVKAGSSESLMVG